MVSFQLEQSTILLALYRIGSTDDMMTHTHTNTERRLLHFAGIFHTNGNGGKSSVALYDNSQELDDKAKARIAGVNSGVMLWVITGLRKRM